MPKILAMQSHRSDRKRSMPLKRTYGTLETSRAVGTTDTIVIDEQNHRGNFRAIVICLCSLFGLLAILFIAYIFCISMLLTCLGPFNPPVGAPKDWSDFKNQSFAVGFDLTAGYG